MSAMVRRYYHDSGQFDNAAEDGSEILELNQAIILIQGRIDRSPEEKRARAEERQSADALRRALEEVTQERDALREALESVREAMKGAAHTRT